MYTAREMRKTNAAERGSAAVTSLARSGGDGGDDEVAKRPSQETRRSNLDEIGFAAGGEGEGRFSTPATLDETYTVCDSQVRAEASRRGIVFSRGRVWYTAARLESEFRVTKLSSVSSKTRLQSAPGSLPSSAWMRLGRLRTPDLRCARADADNDLVVPCALLPRWRKPGETAGAAVLAPRDGRASDGAGGGLHVFRGFHAPSLPPAAAVRRYAIAPPVEAARCGIAV